MVDRGTQNSSRIPVPVRSSPVPTLIPVPVKSPTLNNKVAIKQSNSDQHKHAFHENGLVDTHTKLEETKSQKDSNAKKDKGFETFVMTGDMIIRTTSSQKTRCDSKGNRNTSDSTDTSDTADISDLGVHTNAVFIEEKGVQEYSTLTKANQVSAESGFEDPGHISDSGTFEKEKEENHVTEPSSVSDLSLVSSEELADLTRSQSSAVSSVSTPSDIKSDISEQTVLQRNIGSDLSPSTDDSNSRVLSPELQKENASDTCSSSENEKDDTGTEKIDHSKMVTSKSAEKFVITKGAGGHQVVRSSKSQELQSGTEFSLVAIDIDDDSKAYSLDQIPQHAITNSTPSLESIGEKDIMQTSRSLDSSPEHKVDKSVDKEFIPGFITLDDPQMKKIKTKDSKMENGAMFDSVEGYLSNNTARDRTSGPLDSQSHSNESDNLHRAERDSLDPSMDPNLLEYQPLIKGVDQPSAHRLAKRLYNLDGFRKSDVSRHLSKKNDFGNLVAEEYLKFFHFEKDSLDVALRKFLTQFCLIGETQERERILAHFSKHYVACNPGLYNSEDACHTLTCAIMLLNTDLHGQSASRKMTCSEFIENLSELNDGDNFPKDLLKSVYQAIKAEAIEWAVDDEPADEHNHIDERTTVLLPVMPAPALGHNPFLDVPDPAKTTEYKNGYVMRKCCMDSSGHRTNLGKRGWKMLYVCLRDMILYLYKDQHGMKKGQLVEGSHNAIRIHHSLASKAADYTKKQHVFRLHTADGGEFLFQTSDSKELQGWIDTVNYVAASLSAPQLPGAVGSQKKFQRPLLPASYTRYNLHEQLRRHEEMSQQVERDLQEHRQCPPEKGSKTRIIHDYIEKENYLEYELKRYKTYTYLLQSRLASFQELEPSLVETAIGEDEENGTNQTQEGIAEGSLKKGVQRSLSDRDDISKEKETISSPCVADEEYVNEDSFITHL